MVTNVLAIQKGKGLHIGLDLLYIIEMKIFHKRQLVHKKYRNL